MAGLNKVMLIGRVGNDPEIKNIANDNIVARASIATNETYTDKSGQKITKTEWHRLVFWRGLAGVVEKYVKKGDMIFVEGRLRTTSYEKEGVTHYSTEIQVDNMTMLGGKSGGESTTYEKPESKPPYNNNNTKSVVKENTEDYTDISEMGDGDDLPF
jgi:single-strand DNA-binding protein